MLVVYSKVLVVYSKVAVVCPKAPFEQAKVLLELPKVSLEVAKVPLEHLPLLPVAAAVGGLIAIGLYQAEFHPAVYLGVGVG